MPTAFGVVAGLGVQLRGLQVGFALDVLRLGRVQRDALELDRGLPCLAGLAVGHGQLPGDVGSEFALGIDGAEMLEHLDGARPLLEVDQGCAPASYSACDGDLGRARHLRDAQEVVDRAGGVAGFLLGLGLAVHRRGDALGEIGAHLVVRRQQVARRDVALLGLGELQQVEVRLADDGVRDAPLRRVGRRLVRQHQVRDLDGALQVLRGEDVLGGARQHAGAVGMLGEAGAELDAGIHRQPCAPRPSRPPAARLRTCA